MQLLKMKVQSFITTNYNEPDADFYVPTKLSFNTSGTTIHI